MRWRPTIYSTARPVLLMVLSAALLFAAPARSQNLDPSLSTGSSLLEINLHELGYDTSRGNPRLPQFVDFTDSNHFQTKGGSAHRSDRAAVRDLRSLKQG